MKNIVKKTQNNVGVAYQNPKKQKNRTVGELIKRPKAITLISLVITIVVLVILSAVAIYLTLGNNGILNKAEQAKNETVKQTATEKMNLKITNMQIEKYAQEQRMPTLQEFADGLCEDDEIQYVQLQSKKVGSLDKVEVGEADSIFTKLKAYPYEFEINSSLQLASIDGIQVAANDTVTIPKEEYENIKKDIENLKNEVASKKSNIIGIDSTNVLQDITLGTEYIATEDCIVTGWVATYETNASYFNISIDEVQISVIGGSQTCWWDRSEVYYPLKKGQKFLLSGGNSNYMSYTVKVYGIKID